MECPSCHKQVPDGARFCPFCSTDLSRPAEPTEPTARLEPVQEAAPPPQQPTPVPAAAPPAVTVPGAAPVAIAPPAKAKSTPPWMIAGGISCAAVILLAILAGGIYLVVRSRSADMSIKPIQQPSTGTEAPTETPTGEPATATTQPETTSTPQAGLSGEWNIVYWGGEGDWPSAVSLREEGSSVVGEIIGRNETHIELSPAGSVRWTGTYTDANMPDGVPAIATLPGADRIRLVDDNIPGLDNVILIADRPGGSDFGPHPRAETDDQAIEAVSAEPKVAAWLQEIEQAKAQGRKTSARFEIEENFDDYCIVHVFEMVEDDGGGGHTATFGRYFVWKGSGLVVFLP